MKYHYDLSVIVPGIRPQFWETVYDQATKACQKYSVEFIFSGPYPLSKTLQESLNVKYIKNFGSPSRAFHLGTRIADGRFISILADDCHVFSNNCIDRCLDLLLANNPDKDIVIQRYREGENFGAGEFPIGYWYAYYHGDTKQPGIDPSWALTLTPMMSLQRYNELGGIDCLYCHTNMNFLDLGFRAARSGSNVFLSPVEVMNCNFEPNRTPENSAVINAYVNNDRDRFYKMYADNSRPMVVEENWRECDPVWKRRNF